MAVVERAFRNTQVLWRKSDVISALNMRVGGPASPGSDPSRRMSVEVPDPECDRLESLYAVPGAATKSTMPAFHVREAGGLEFTFDNSPVHDDPGAGPALLGFGLVGRESCRTGPISITAHPVVLLVPHRAACKTIPGPGIPYAHAVCTVLLLAHDSDRKRYVLRLNSKHQQVSRSDLPPQAIDPEASEDDRTQAVLAWANSDIGPAKQLHTILRAELALYNGDNSHIAIPVPTGSPENLMVARATDTLGAAFVRMFATDVARDMVAGQLMMTTLTMVRHKIVKFPLMEESMSRLRPSLHASTLLIGDSMCKVADPDDCVAYEVRRHADDRHDWPVFGASKAVQRVYFATLAMGEGDDDEGRSVPFRKRRRVEHPFKPSA